MALDWSQKWAEARSQSSSLVHEILIPSGCTVQSDGQTKFTKWTGSGNGTGGIVIRTAGDSRLFPPQGVRIDPSYAHVVGGFSAPANRSIFGASALYTPFTFVPGSDDVCFQNLKFTLPAPEETNHVVRLAGVEGPSNNTLIAADTLAEELKENDIAMIDFDDCDGLQGAKRIFEIDRNSSQIRIAGGPYQAKGTCESGRAVFFTGARIESIENTHPPRVNFTSEHGFYDLERLLINSIVSNSDGSSSIVLDEPMHVTRGQERYIRAGDTISLSKTALKGRLITVSSSTLTTVSIPGSVSCVSDCGTIREHHPVAIARSNMRLLNGAHHYNKVDLDTIELLDTTGLGSGSPGGYAFHDAGLLLPLIDIGWRSRIGFDRVLGDCGRFPYRSAICIVAGRTNGISIANSFFIGPKRPFTVDPVSGRIRDSVENFANSSPRFLGYNHARDVQVRNTAIVDTHGIVFGGDAQCNSRMSDITFQRVIIDKPNAYIAGHAESNGFYYNDRHGLEFKCGERILLDGLYVAGSWADATPGAPALIFRGIGGSNGSKVFPTSDITLRGIHLARSASGVQFLQGSVSHHSPPLQRVSITDSLFEELDFYQYASKPGQISGTKRANCCNFSGAWLLFAGDQSDIRISNNTLGEQRCRGIGCLLDIGGGFKTNFEFEANVAPLSKSAYYGLNQEDNGKNAFVPSCEGLGGGRPVWECRVHQISADGGHVPDPNSVFRDNVFFGGLENMYVSESDFDLAAMSTSDSVTVSSNEVGDYFSWWTDGNFYPSGASMNARIESSFLPGSWQSSQPGRGYDEARFRAYRGLIGEVSLTDLGSGSARIVYDGPQSAQFQPERCWLDYSIDPGFGEGWWLTGARIADSGAAGERVVELHGLRENREYSWRLSCPGTQTRGQFRTGFW